MFITDKYSQLISQINSYSDEEYLQLQLDELNQLFFREVSAIKNIRLEYIAFSNAFAREFNFNQTNLGTKQEDLPNQNQSLLEDTVKQELAIMASKQPQNTLLNTKINNQNNCYFVRKFPLVNPATTNCVGLLIFPTKIDILNFRKLISNRIFNRTKSSSTVVSKKFSEKESLIISCLLLGFHKRKEIAAIIEKSTQHELTDLQIRNSLQTLYERYKCNSTAELTELICASQADIYQLHEKLFHNEMILLEE